MCECYNGIADDIAFVNDSRLCESIGSLSENDAKKTVSQHRMAVGAEWASARRCFHDIFANPFRRIILDDTRLTPEVKTLAQAIYDDRAFDRMPKVAAALEEAGCTNADMLDHCRKPAEHVRGCWVVDLLLGKE